ncbi:hypothetical protein EXIGLDRAFT_720000 [Exidia glandulosa HHB12029]|uniref:Sas10 C-terminal domain-containing protein n=1 Tax=Exidia glandulosa HHB12029 TaxID=1314781 RepID=A0A165NLT7_EXIGL|nr:hypothetical protein EXIGLDRAFT_720000 [Exidia glandulosa HHB12029]
MARSSKSQSQSRRSKSKSKASVARWERDEDIPLDEQEEFHTSRDRILLEGEDDADEDFEEDDEVFALRGVGVDEDSSSGSPSDSEEPTPSSSASTSASTKKSKSKSKKKKAEKKEDESEEEEGWGRKKSVYYATGDDDEHDDEEAARLQEEEARRVQAKMRADMTDDDFGLGDLRIADPAPDATADPTTFATTPAATALPKEKDALRAHLARHSPETLALAREWDDVAHALLKATRALEKTQAAKPDALSLGLLHVHHQTLQTYATTLAFYFHLRASEPYAGRPELLRAHPILKRLLTLKQALATLEELDFGGSSSDEDEDSEDESTDADLDEDVSDEDDAGWRQLELADLLKDSTTHGELDAADGIQRRARARVKSLKAQPLESIPELPEPKKKKKTTVTYDLVEPAFVSSKSSGKNKTTDTDADGFGDPMVLQSADAADKKARRRTLQFHAARIDAGAARRAGARAARMGGDEDVPYPERKKEAEKRRAEENARRRARGEDLDDEEPVERPRKRQRDEEEEGHGDEDGDEEGYYELVSRGRKEAKKAKREAYEAERAAERIVDDDADETNGPRALTRAILKNKGLTPHRAKSVRNPRVKKKLRYEKAKKKVASQKAVFKGGAAASKGVYEGEKSGINSRVVKSTRLG